MMQTYNRIVNKAEAKKQEASHLLNEYVGAIGDKIQKEFTLKNYFMYDTVYGTMVIYIFEDAEGYQYKWNTKTCIEQERGEKLTIKGTIKEHSEYNEVKQTVLTRCKIV